MAYGSSVCASDPEPVPRSRARSRRRGCAAESRFPKWTGTGLVNNCVLFKVINSFVNVEPVLHHRLAVHESRGEELCREFGKQLASPWPLERSSYNRASDSACVISAWSCPAFPSCPSFIKTPMILSGPPPLFGLLENSPYDLLVNLHGPSSLACASRKGSQIVRQNLARLQGQLMHDSSCLATNCGERFLQLIHSKPSDCGCGLESITTPAWRGACNWKSLQILNLTPFTSPCIDSRASASSSSIYR